MIVSFFTINIIALITGFIIDCILGDPRNIPHTICMIGNRISRDEKWLRNAYPKDDKSLRQAGKRLVVLVITTTVLFAGTVLSLSALINVHLYYIVSSLMCWQVIAAKSLKTESQKVYTALKEKPLEEAQQEVAMIVGRDTDVLDEKGVAKATIETIAENTSDGVIAPMLYCLIGGPVLGYIYKAINTMDSMVGYKNEKYIDFGRCAAKLDDVANYLPSRFCAFLMMISAFILRYNYKNSYKIWARDRKKHASPNSAQTESVCAGALEIQLAGNAVYKSIEIKKDFIGEDIKQLEYQDIIKANRLMYTTAFLFICLSLTLLLPLIGIKHW